MTDSGYTEREIEALLAPFMVRGPDLAEENLATALAIGLLDGDVIALSERGTVMLSTPKAEIERRLAVIRAKMAAGSTVDEAIEAAVR